jgi:hypothetical protein
VAIQPEWRRQQQFDGWAPFRLFEEVVPPLVGKEKVSAIKTIVAILKRHYKLLMMTAAAEIELGKLARKFSNELNKILDFVNFYVSLQGETAQERSTALLEILEATANHFKSLLELSEPLESDPTFLQQVSFSIRLCLLHWLYLCNPSGTGKPLVSKIMQQHIISILQSVSSVATTLCRPVAIQTHSGSYCALYLQYLQTLFRLQLGQDEASSLGSSIWHFVSETLKTMSSSESKWSLVLLVAANNSSALIHAPLLLQYPGWEVVQELLAADLLKTPSNVRSSPTKDPTGPSRGIQDLMLRFRYFCGIWPSPPLDVIALLGRYFADRLWRPSALPLEYYDQEGIRNSPHGFDTYLSILSDAIYSASTIETRKIRIQISKNIEIFLNILDDLPSRNLDAHQEVPILLRNCFQFAIISAPFMSDTDVQNVLLERLLAFEFESLSPLASRLVIQGSFRLLSVLSRKSSLAHNHIKKEVRDELEDIYGFLATDYTTDEDLTPPNGEPKGIYLRNVDLELVPFDQARKSLISKMAGSMLDHLVSSYLHLLANAGTVPSSSLLAAHTTTSTHLAQGISKKSKYGSLAVDFNGGPIVYAEKAVTTYMKQLMKTCSTSLSSAMLDLVALNRFGELLASTTVSVAVRRSCHDALQALIVATRYTTLESEVKSKMDTLWKSAARPFYSSSTPPKVVQSVGELQGLMVQVLGDQPLWHWSELISTVYRRDAVFRTTPIFALRTWLELLHAMVKGNLYRTPYVAPNTAFAVGSILINAGLEANPHPAQVEILQLIRGFSRSAIGNFPIPLHFLAQHIIDLPTLELAQRNPPPGIVSKKILENFQFSKKENPTLSHEWAPFFPQLLRHIDTVISQNRSELSNGSLSNSKLLGYDDMVYPCVAYFLKTVPFWLHNTADPRYNVFKSLMTELFIAPIQAMAVSNANPDSSTTTASHNSRTGPNSGISSSTAAASSAGVQLGTGMILGVKGPKATSSRSAPTASALPPSSAQQRSRIAIGPTSVNENAIRMLPLAMHALAQLDLESSAELQRNLCDITVGVFRSFLSGKEGTPDARLIEQFANGFVGFDANVDTSSPEYMVLEGRLKLVRTFFFANVVPWLTKSIEKGDPDSFDTNAFVLARVLSWILLKLKHVPHSEMELVSLFLMSVHYILDLFRSRKPTSGSLVKKELIGYVTTFCSTIYKLVRHSAAMPWIQSQDLSCYQFLASTFKEVVFALLRDFEYIANGKWPTATNEAALQTSLRLDHVNGVFERQIEASTVPLSVLVLVDPSGPVDGLKDLARTEFQILEYLRLLGALEPVAAVMDSIKRLIYEPDPAFSARHARADVKGAIEVWRQEFVRLSIFFKK